MNSQAELARIPAEHLDEYVRQPVTSGSLEMYIDSLTLRDPNVTLVASEAGGLAIAYSEENQ